MLKPVTTNLTWDRQLPLGFGGVLALVLDQMSHPVALLAQKPIFGLYLGLKRVQKGPLCIYTEPNWCQSISIKYPTMNGSLLDPNMCLLGPKRPFGGPKTNQILIFGPKKVRMGPFSNYKGPNWC